MINAFEAVTGLKLNYHIGDRRPGDIEKVWGDVSMSNSLLGWKGEHGIAGMMRSAWAWEQTNAKFVF